VRTDDQELTLSVPDDAKITENGEEVGLVGLEEADPVLVRYFSPSPGSYTVVSIQDNNGYDAPVPGTDEGGGA